MADRHRTISAASAADFDNELDAMSAEGWTIVAIWHTLPGEWHAYARHTQWSESFNATLRRPQPK